jgi:hypothetical protein
LAASPDRQADNAPEVRAPSNAFCYAKDNRCLDKQAVWFTRKDEIARWAPDAGKPLLSRLRSNGAYQ